MSRQVYSLLALVVLAVPAATAQSQTAPAGAGFDVVFVADGAGNYQVASKMLRTVAAEINAPFAVETFVWSHGYKKSIPDQTDLAHSRQQGKLLADFVLAYRKAHPQARISLLGHSAGSMVVLSAAEFLPADTLNRIVLLLPSVSTEYDMRPALRSVRESVEVHFSDQDWFYLGVCTRLVGCADRRNADAGGRVGFQLRIDGPADAALLPKLIQYPWQPTYRTLGNDGGHYGAYQPAYLKAYIIPALLRP